MKKIILSLSLALIVLSSALAQQGRNALPEIGVVASDAISIDKELQIGRALMMQLRSQAPLVYDPVLEEYLNDVGNRLVAQADNVKFPFQFFWIRNPEINAFAFFGGHVGVHTGLINYADNESELASVLAHEVSHVTQRHIARRIAAQKKASSLHIASMIGGILLALADPEAGVAAISATNAASQQFAINYTRSNEQEADRVAFRMMDLAGFDTAGASAFFGKLVEKYRVQSKPPAFLLTHPLPESRVADARARENMYERRQLPPSLPFHLAKARVHARYSYDAKYNIAHFKAQLDKQSYVLKEAAIYGLAIAYYEAQQIQNAHDTLQPLLQSDPENLFYVDLATDIAISQNRAEMAVNNLSKLDRKIPKNQVISLNLANAAIRDGQHDKAIAVLKDYLLVNPGHALTYQLLTEAYGGKKAFMQMHQSKAEWLALNGAHPRAIDELQTAYNYTGDSNIEKQRIRARIEQLRHEQKRLETL